MDGNSKSTDALIVFAKAPKPGNVKTRLTTKLPEEDAALLYEAFLKDALAQYALLNVAVHLYMAPPLASSPTFEDTSGVTLHPQEGRMLGERMQNAFEKTFTLGCGRVVIIGTDHPTLPSSFIKEAYEQLSAGEQLVIGPSLDGGYYLLGMNTFLPFIFADMTYSHNHVLQHTVERARDEGIAPYLLPAWYDVDTPEDLKRLISDLETSTGSAQHTRDIMRAMDLLPS